MSSLLLLIVLCSQYSEVGAVTIDHLVTILLPRSGHCRLPSRPSSPGRAGTLGRSLSDRTCPGCTDVRAPSDCSAPGPALTSTIYSPTSLAFPASSRPEALRERRNIVLLLLSLISSATSPLAMKIFR